MENIYEMVRSNPKLFTWIFIFVNAIWVVFKHIDKKSHDRAMEKLKHSYKIKEVGDSHLIQKLQELEELAGEAKESATSYQSTACKREHYSRTKIKLEEFAGQFGKHQPLVQAIRDLNNRCAIMTQDDSHGTCREEVIAFYKVLLKESENVKRSITA
jgi:hypothetical protein